MKFTLEYRFKSSVIAYSKFEVILSLNVAASATIMSAHANPQIPLGAPPLEGVDVGP